MAATAPTIKIARTLWGVDGFNEPSKWDELFGRIKAEGFDAIECTTLTWRCDPKLLRELLDKHELGLICQIHTTGGDIDATTGEYQYLTSSKLHAHLASFVKLLTEAAALKPLFVNSHSGHDSWSTETAVAFFKYALTMEASLGVTVVHETHRQRLLWNPYSTAEILKTEALKGKLKVNCDLSHWCCVCEHVFDATSARDDWWPATLALVAEHCHFVHCRVGHAEGPQVNDPEAPEHAKDVDAHFGWWRTIWQAQAARAGAPPVVWAEPEFGPPPYMQTLPFTNEPVSDWWKINSRLMVRIRSEHARALEEAATKAAAAEAEAAAAAAAAAPKVPKKKWVHTLGGQQGGGYVQVDVEDEEAATKASGLAVSAALRELAVQDGDAVAAAKAAAEAQAQARAAAQREGNLKGAEMAAAARQTGVTFFCTPLVAAAGELPLLNTALQAMNAPADAAGGGGGAVALGKMLFSAAEGEQLAIVTYVPSGHNVIDVSEWTASVLEAIGGKVMLGPPKMVSNGTEEGRGTRVEAAVAADPDAGKSPTKDLDVGLAAAFAFLKHKGALPTDLE